MCRGVATCGNDPWWRGSSTEYLAYTTLGLYLFWSSIPSFFDLAVSQVIGTSICSRNIHFIKGSAGWPSRLRRRFLSHDRWEVVRPRLLPKFVIHYHSENFKYCGQTKTNTLSGIESAVKREGTSLNVGIPAHLRYFIEYLTLDQLITLYPIARENCQKFFSRRYTA